MGPKAIVGGWARMLQQQHPMCFHLCGSLPPNPVAVRAAHSSPRVTARGMRASPQIVAVAAEPPTGGAPVQNTGQRKGETSATAVVGTPAGAGAYGETVLQSSAWSARRLRRCRHWIAPASSPHARRALPRPASPSPWWLCSYVQRASAPCTWAESSLPSRTSVPSAPRRCVHG